MKRSITLIVLLVCLGFTAIWGWNYSALQGPLARVISGDSRNDGVEASAHFASYINSSQVIFDLQSVKANKAPADVFRILLQFAQAIQERQFEQVVLAHRGTPKFLLDGTYFRQLGAEYSVQNPVYTMRTFPEHLKRLNGSQAFEQWTGGILGVLNGQLHDFGEFNKQWYASDLNDP